MLFQILLTNAILCSLAVWIMRASLSLEDKVNLKHERWDQVSNYIYVICGWAALSLLSLIVGLICWIWS